MGIRKDLTTLSSEEKKAFITTVLELKKIGIYDKYVEEHNDAMANVTTVTGEIPHPGVRNSAHRGPAFFPWHREFLRRFELDLQKIDPEVSLPYWDWTADAELDDPTTAIIWSEDFMGGNGKEEDDWRVKTGPFAYEKGNWPIRTDLNGPALQRQLGQIYAKLPTLAHVQNALRQIYYDTPPWDSSPFTRGFRNLAEGWVTPNADASFEEPGTQLHNRVHVWVGGSMLPGTSPNDPVFFLHHCFLDKIWANWQKRMRDPELGAPELAPHYFPICDGPPGHNLYDPMYPWGGSATPASVLDNDAIGVTYVDKPTTPELFVATETALAVRKINTIVPDSPYC